MGIKTGFEEEAANAAANGGESAATGFGAAPIPTAPAAFSTLNETITQTAAGFETTQARMREGMDKAMKTAEDFMAFGQGNSEALVKSGQIWPTGLQDLGKTVPATATARIAGTPSAVKAIAGPRPAEASRSRCDT